MTNPSVYKYSQTAADNDDADIDGGVDWRENQITVPDINDSARAMMAGLANFLDDIAGGTATTGSSNAYLFTTAQDTDLTQANVMIGFKANHANTGAATLNVNGAGASAIQLNGSALTGGEIQQNGVYLASWISSAWEIIGSGAPQGENLGAGVGVFETASGTSLQFNSLVAAAGVSISEDDANDEIDIGVDIDGLTADASPTASTDYVMIHTAAGLKKVLLEDMPYVSSVSITTAQVEAVVSNAKRYFMGQF